MNFFFQLNRIQFSERNFASKSYLYISHFKICCVWPSTRERILEVYSYQNEYS